MTMGLRSIAGVRRLVLLFVIAALPLAALTSPAAAQAATQPAGGGTWRSQHSGTIQDLHDISCVDADRCWAVGNQGTILATADGGRNWVAQDSGTFHNLIAVSFVDATHGWVLGVNMNSPHAGAWWTFVLATADGGKTWTQTSTDEFLDQLVFVDATYGWMSGQLFGNIKATADGGKTWTAQYKGSATRQFPADVSFVDRSHGWAVVVGEDGTVAGIMFTTDGGQTWTRTDVNLPSSKDFRNSVALSFVDTTHGWAVGWGTILATTDGGRTWTAQPAGVNDHLRDVAFVDRYYGWVVGPSGVILSTENAGSTWNVYRPGREGLRAVAFADRNHGWVVGDSGLILAYAGPGAAPAGPAPGQGGVRVLLDGRELFFDVPPVIQNGRTLVPFRAIMEALGMSIGWDPATRKVTGRRGDLTLELTIGSTTAYRNGQPVTLDVPAQIVGGRTLVPLRFISEQSGARVSWDGQQKLVTISTGP